MLLKNNKTSYTSVPVAVLVYMSWRNIAMKKLRSFLTIAGVVIGVGSIYFLMSLGLGLQNLVTNEVVGGQSMKSVDITSPNSQIVKLNDRSVKTIHDLPYVESVGRSFSYAGSVKFKGSESDTIVYGVDSKFQSISDIQATKGRLLKDDDQLVAYLNEPALKAIGFENSSEEVLNAEISLVVPLQVEGKTDIEINEQFKIIGIIDSGAGSEIFIPRGVIERLGATQYNQVKLIAEDTTYVSDLRKKIESLGFETASPIDTVDQINQIFKYFNFMLIGFGAIGMFIAVLGMFNTLTISLLERTREIGLMISLGARQKDMRLLFIMEAAILSLVGSVIGILLAFLLGVVINTVMNQLASNRGVPDSFNLFSNPLWLIGTLVVFMLVIGLLVVILPARKAEKTDPIEALRNE